MRAIDPATDQVVGEYPEHTPEQVASLLERAHEAFRKWRDVPLDERGGLMRRAGAQLRRRSSELALLMTREMGKPIVQAEQEIEKCAVGCDYFAEHARRYLAPEEIESDADRSFVRFDPLGAVLAIMPW